MARSAADCGVCDLFNIEQKSAVWCYECDEGLCLDCKRHHGLSDEKSHHKIIPIVDSGQLLPFLKVKEVCQEHDQSNCFYCHMHDIALCKICLKSHDCYRAISCLKDNINLRKPNSFEYIESVLKEVTQNIKKLKDNIQTNLSDTFEQRERLKEEIDNARKKINLYLDQLQETISFDLSEAEKNIKSQADKSTRSLTQMAKQVKECEMSIDNVKKYTPDITDLKLFLSKEQVYSDVTDIEKCMQSLIDDRKFNNFHLSFKIDQVMNNLLHSDSFGKININKEATPIENEIYANIEQRMIRRISPPQAHNSANLTLLYKADTNHYDIIGCALLADGKIALCRSLYPSTVTLWNQGGSHEAEIDYATSSASGITSFDKNTFAVSSGRSGIKLVELSTKKTQMTLPCSSFGDICPIGLTGKKFIFCSRDFVLKTINISDFSITSVKRLSQYPYIAAFDNKVYYTNKSLHSVTCCDIKGRTFWEFKNTSVLLEPCGITVDSKGNIYVVDPILSRVVVISPDGEQHFVLLSREDGINTAQDLDCDRKTNRLLVANRGGSIFVYNIDYEGSKNI